MKTPSTLIDRQGVRDQIPDIMYGLGKWATDIFVRLCRAIWSSA